jgi:hypothetical protein
MLQKILMIYSGKPQLVGELIIPENSEIQYCIPALQLTVQPNSTEFKIFKSNPIVCLIILLKYPSEV